MMIRRSGKDGLQKGDKDRKYWFICSVECFVHGWTNEIHPVSWLLLMFGYAYPVLSCPILPKPVHPFLRHFLLRHEILRDVHPNLHGVGRPGFMPKIFCTKRESNQRLFAFQTDALSQAHPPAKWKPSDSRRRLPGV